MEDYSDNVSLEGFLVDWFDARVGRFGKCGLVDLLLSRLQLPEVLLIWTVAVGVPGNP